MNIQGINCCEEKKKNLSRICKEYTAQTNLWGEIGDCHVSANNAYGILTCGAKR